MKYFIITGTSRGVGESMAEQLVSPDHYLFCISRERNESLASKSSNITYYEFDLNHIHKVKNYVQLTHS